MHAMTRSRSPCILRSMPTVVMLAAMLSACLAGSARAGGTGTVFVSNERSSDIFMLDGNDKVIGSFKTCGRPRGMRFTRDHNHLIVACGNDDTIAIYDVATHALVRRFRDISDPETFDLSPNGHDLYISNEDDAEATLIDIETGAVKAHFPTGAEPEGVLATPDGKRVFVASEAADLVHVIDADAGKPIKDILVATRPRRLALTPDGKELWVSSEIGGVINVIDTETLTVASRIEFNPPGVRHDEITPVDVVIDLSGTKAYVALGRVNHVAVIDVKTHKAIDYILTGRRPWGLRLKKDGRKLYVANGLSDDVTIIDTLTNRAIKSVPVGIIPYAILIDE